MRTSILIALALGQSSVEGFMSSRSWVSSSATRAPVETSFEGAALGARANVRTSASFFEAEADAPDAAPAVAAPVKPSITGTVLVSGFFDGSTDLNDQVSSSGAPYAFCIAD